MRDEVCNALSQSKVITLESLSRMPKVDSFMKEVVRMRPGTLSKYTENESGLAVKRLEALRRL